MQPGTPNVGVHAVTSPTNRRESSKWGLELATPCPSSSALQQCGAICFRGIFRGTSSSERVLGHWVSGVRYRFA